MKALFITGIVDGNGGGHVITNRNKQLLCRLLGDANVGVFSIPQKRETLKSVFERCAFAYVVGMDSKNVESILCMVENVDFVWIDGSCYGTIAKVLKQNGYRGRVITFFHNIERYFQKRTFIKNLLFPLYNGPLLRSETNAIMYSDKIVTLTERDASYVRKMNGILDVTILPSSMKDTMEDKDGYTTQNSIAKQDFFQLLFVGSYFYANVNGLSWFVEKVLPKVNAKLIVVGAKMDKLPFKNSEKLEIHGFVENLGEYYRKCDAVVAPIFEGSGMKTKTTEALMWGKYIIGTDESFCGFSIDNAVGLKCNTEDDFIKNINRLSESGICRFNYPSRELYLKYYSIERSMEIIKEIVYGE